MTTTTSKSEKNRRRGKHQVEEQRTSILDAAEQLFLQNGLENTRMIDIAHQAGITKVTLYRYFANRDEVALAIQVRMLDKISRVVAPGGEEFSLESQRRRAQAMIRNFPILRDAFRYIGMFDRVYLDHAPDEALTQWTKDQLTSATSGRVTLAQVTRQVPHGNELSVIMNNVIWFLEKLALRGEVTWSDKEIPLAAHLQVFEDLIMGYFDRIGE